MKKIFTIIAGLSLLLAFAQCKKTDNDQTHEVNKENIEQTDNAMEFIDNNIQAQLDLLADKDIPEVMESLAEWFSEQDGVIKAISYNDSIIITFVDESDAILTIYDRTVKDDIEYDLSQFFPRNGSSTTQEAITIGNHEVFIYDAYARLSVLDLREGDSIDKYFSECGYEPIHLKDEQCTIESLRDLTQYGYILLATHGLRNAFATREAVTRENRWLYMEDRLNGKLRVGYNVYRNEDGYLCEGKFYNVTKKFIHELNGQFNNAIVFNSSCDGLKGNTPLKRAFLEKGVATYYGFDDDVYDKYKFYASAFVAKMLLSGFSTGDAAEVFKANYPQASYGTRFDMAGRDDVTWYDIPPVPTDGLIAYYPFNGNANDESGNGHDGEIIGNVTLTEDRKGNVNGAYRFYGEPYNYISVPDHEDFHLSVFTLNAWVFTDAEDYGSEYLICKGRDIINGAYRLRVTSVGATNQYGAVNDAFVEECPQAHEWHMITGSVQGDQAKLYIDGVLMDERTLSNPFVFGNTDPLTLGMHYYVGVPTYWAYPLLGIMDDVRIYNRVLTPEEIIGLYKE